MAEQTPYPPDDSPQLPALPDDAARDSARPMLEEEPYRQAVRGRITAFPFALGLITLGGLLLAQPYVEGFTVTPLVGAVIMLAALVLTNLFRFFASGRRERGLFFLALVILAFGIVVALMSVSIITPEWWPLTLVGVALALFITFLGERQHERGLLGLSVLVMLAAGVAFAVTLDVVPSDLTDSINDYWPLLVAFIGVTLIPLALRRSMR